ncbi:MAG: hypothetical protein Q9170_001703 [Blastenia crenularia]
MAAIFDDASRTIMSPSVSRPLSVRVRRPDIAFPGTSDDIKDIPKTSNGSIRRRIPTDVSEPYQLSKLQPVVRNENLSHKAHSVAQRKIDPQLDSGEVVYPNLRQYARHTIDTATASKRSICSPMKDVKDWLDGVYDHQVLHASKMSEVPKSKSISASWTPLPTRRTLWRPPSGPCTEPPKRNSARISPCMLAISRTPPAGSDQQFMIYEDEASSSLAVLSPNVEQHRKGRAPKRERCANYWDKDILPELSNTPKISVKKEVQRRLLGDLTSMAKGKGFVKGAEKAGFEFRVPP